MLITIELQIIEKQALIQKFIEIQNKSTNEYLSQFIIYMVLAIKSVVVREAQLSKLVQGKWGLGDSPDRGPDYKYSQSIDKEPNILLFLLQLCEEYVGSILKGVSHD